MGELWRKLAACRGAETRVFYPDDGVSFGLARQFCEGCPVRSQCHEYALEHEAHGFWAGMTAKERRGERRRMGLALQDPGAILSVEPACGTMRGYRAHLRHGEETCVECRQAWAIYTPPQTHGTEAGYRGHRRRDEQACDACVEAHTAKDRRRRARARAAS